MPLLILLISVFVLVTSPAITKKPVVSSKADASIERFGIERVSIERVSIERVSIERVGIEKQQYAWSSSLKKLNVQLRPPKEAIYTVENCVYLQALGIEGNAEHKQVDWFADRH